MKKYLHFLCFAFVTTFLLSACTSTPKTDELAAAALKQQATAQNTDTVGLAQFHAWKAQNELVDVEEAKEPVQYTPAQTAKPIYKAPVRKAPKPVASRVPTPPTPVSTNASDTEASNTSTDASNGGTASSESEGTAKAPEKKRISKAAKGAVIGGVVGAVGGAIINKDNRVVGAVIGGVIGAGGGYGIGRGMDKKDGRIEMIQN